MTPAAAPPAAAPFRPTGPTTAGLAIGTPMPSALPPPSKIRLHRDPPESPPTRLLLPSPEELGVGATVRSAVPVSHGAPFPPAAPVRPVLIDWNLTHQRLKDMGAVGFHLDRVAEGQVRATFWLPTADRDRTHLVEATAVSEAEAVTLALTHADTFRLARR